MDLAKIRKKSLLSLDEAGAKPAAAPLPSPGQVQDRFEAAPAVPVSADVDFFQTEQISAAPYSCEAPSFDADTAFPKCVLPARSPLEAILAGRTAAGCDDESILADDAASETVAESSLEFLCFRVSDEIYGINIMDIKEIIKPREVTEVPRAPLFVSGVLSLRGTIIPVIDMRVRLGLDREETTGKERIVVIKNNNSFSGLLVDEVIQVVQVQLDDVEAAPAILDGIDRDFISGLGRSDGRLIIILNLENIADINLY
jgi:purine-binding chemotaxis protein CheW